MSSGPMKDMLEKRKNRTIAIILAFKDEHDGCMDPDVSAAFRKVILDQINDLYDFTLDMLRSVDSGDVIINEEYVARLDVALNRMESMVGNVP